jgi:hypothetical protein
MRPAATCVSVSGGEGVGARGEGYFAAADDENILVADLPGEEEGASALDFGEFGRH